jgi:hypothetical protein
VRDEDAETLRSIAEEGLLPGVLIEITTRTSGESAIGVSLGKERRIRSIENELARQIYVVPDEG